MRGLCIGGPCAGEYRSAPYETLTVVEDGDGPRLFEPRGGLPPEPQPPRRFRYRRARLCVDGMWFDFWIPEDISLDGEACWILGALCAGYRSPHTPNRRNP